MSESINVCKAGMVGLVCLLACLVLPSGVPKARAAKPAFLVTVAAGQFDRRDTVITFRLPTELQGNNWALRDEAGKPVVLQIDEARQASFTLAELKANATKRFRLEEAKPAAPKGVEVKRDGNRLAVTSGGRLVIGYQAAGELPRPDIKPVFTRGGYIHSVYTPSGLLISDDYPPRHVHHHGVWFAWTKTAFEGRYPDFWNMGDATGTVEFVALDKTWSGPVHAGLRARNRYVDLKAPQPKTVLNEEWQVTVYPGGQGQKPYTMFDLLSTQACATNEPLVLPEYHYGGVGFRGARGWDGKENASFLTSEGKDRLSGHGTRARWCAISGLVDGKAAGIAIFCHPENFRAPQPMRLHPDEPFFCYAPSQLGEWKIAPGQTYRSSYRFVAFDGPPDKAELERLWNDYANPPQVSVSLR